MKNISRLLFILIFSSSIQAKTLNWTSKNNSNLSYIKVNNLDSTSTNRNTQILGPPNFYINCIFVDSLDKLYLGINGDDIYSYYDFATYFSIVKFDTIFSNIFSSHDGKEKYLNNNLKQNIEHSNCYNISTFTIDHSNNIWVGTNDGIIKLDNGKQIYYSTKNGLIDNKIVKIIVDDFNNIWVATPKGVSKFDGKTWISYTTKNGLASDFITSIKADIKNNIWIGTNGGISKFDGKEWTNYNSKSGLINNYITAIEIDSNGDIWFGCRETGSVSKFDGKNWSNLVIDEFNKSNILDIVIDSKGNKWFISFGSYANVAKYDGKILTKYSNENNIDFSNIKSVAIDSKDNIWIGILNDERIFNIIKYDGEKWKTIVIPEKIYSLKKQ